MKKNTDTFLSDLELGEITENELVQSLCENGFKVKPPIEGNPHFDRETECGITFEVKTDRLAQKTGNVAIELYKTLSGRIESSGLTVTTAKWWVTKILGMEGLFYILVDDLVELIETNIGREVKGGDGNRVTMRLIKIDDFTKRCTYIK